MPLGPIPPNGRPAWPTWKMQSFTVTPPAFTRSTIDLSDPAVTVELLRLNAVVGVQGKVNDMGQLTSVGITCALCHSSVDNSFTTGIGRRMDGWANTDLNVGAIVALSPVLDDATRAEFNAWGPGKYDPRHHAFDGTNIIPLNSPSLPIDRRRARCVVFVQDLAVILLAQSGDGLWALYKPLPPRPEGARFG